MKFRIPSTTQGVGNILHPIINGTNYYSPLAFSGGKLISPWSADVVVHPTRTSPIYPGFGDNFVCDWPRYTDDDLTHDLHYLDMKTITAYEKNGTALFYSRAGSNRGVNGSDWAHHYYTGSDSNNDFAGVFWNLNNFSAITPNTTALSFQYNFIFSMPKNCFNSKLTGFSYDWGNPFLLTGHPYMQYFPNDQGKCLKHIDVAGTLQPQSYAFYIALKSGATVENNTSGYLKCGRHYRDYNPITKGGVIESRDINSIVTGASRKKYINNNNRGMVTHFTVDGDNMYDYFHVEGSEPFTALFGNQFYPSGVSTPVINICESTDDVSGATWTNATAHGYFTDGTSASAVGTFKFAPGNNDRNEFLQAVGTPMRFYLEDLSFGFTANV